MDINEKALELHKQWNGKLTTEAKSAVKTREDLSLAYTPGVAEPCKVIAKDPAAAYTYTMKANTVAVVSDGSAVLGLGNIGALAAMPVMEGKCVLFKAFGDVDAFPLCIKSHDVDEIVRSFWIHRIPMRSSVPLQTLHRLSAASIWKISLHQDVLRSKKN